MDLDVDIKRDIYYEELTHRIMEETEKSLDRYLQTESLGKVVMKRCDSTGKAQEKTR